MTGQNKAEQGLERAISRTGYAAITLNGVTIVEQGGRADSYTEAAGSAAMAEEELVIGIRLGRGQQEARIWTSDLSHDYVSINADYRS